MPSRPQATLSQVLADAQAGGGRGPLTVSDVASCEIFVALGHHDGEQEWAVGFRLAPPATATGQWRAIEFAALVGPGPDGGISGKALRSLPLGDLLADARQAASLAQPHRSTRSRKPLLRPSDIRLAPFKDDARGRAPRGDDAYAALALEYALRLERGERSPIKSIAAQHGGSQGTWANRVAEARRRGFLTPVKSGEAGGALTAKAMEVLGMEAETDE